MTTDNHPLLSLFELEPRTVVFAQPFCGRMVSGWVSQPLNHDLTILNLFRNDFLLLEDLKMLDIVHDLFLGLAKDMTAEAPLHLI